MYVRDITLCTKNAPINCEWRTKFLCSEDMYVSSSNNLESRCNSTCRAHSLPLLYVIKKLKSQKKKAK